MKVLEDDIHFDVYFELYKTSMNLDSIKVIFYIRISLISAYVEKHLLFWCLFVCLFVYSTSGKYKICCTYVSLYYSLNRDD